MRRRDLDWKTLGVIALAGAWVGRRLTLPRYDLRDRVVLLTGGSRMLGLELARVFARRGVRLALLARDTEELARRGDQLSEERIPGAADSRHARANSPLATYRGNVTHCSARKRRMTSTGPRKGEGRIRSSR